MTNGIKVVVFDFDGVITPDSEFFKQQAWVDVFFPAYGERYRTHFEAAEKEYGGGRGGDRYDILRATFMGLGEPAERIEKLVRWGAHHFDVFVQEKIYVAGIELLERKALEELSIRLPIYLNSATPVAALRRTVHNLELCAYITGVLGRPHSKVENFRRVAFLENVSPKEILFVGDSDSDCKAAEAFGCDFVGFANSWNRWMENKPPLTLMSSLTEVGIYL